MLVNGIMSYLNSLKKKDSTEKSGDLPLVEPFFTKAKRILGYFKILPKSKTAYQKKILEIFLEDGEDSLDYSNYKLMTYHL